MSKRLKDAREGFRKKDMEASRDAHRTDRIRRAEERHKGAGENLGDFVFGAIDGSVTTFAVVSGVAGASLSNAVLLILGFANLFADGFSMAVGNYLSTKSDREYAVRERERETWEVEHFPEGEREEVREIYRRKGLSGEQLDKVVDAVTSNEKLWVDTMMTEELGLMNEPKDPVRSGLITFSAFVTVGFVPLFSYVLALFIPAVDGISYLLSIVLTGIAFFLIGASKVYITGKAWWKSGLETLSMGGAAAGIAYAVGYFLKGLA